MQRSLWTVFRTLTIFGFALVAIQPLLAPVARAETITQDTAVATNLGLYGGELQQFAVNPNTATVYATTLSPSGLFRSDNKGSTWTGLDSTTNYGLGKSVVVDAANNTVYALLGDTLLQSTDDGITWTDISSGITAPAFSRVMFFGQGRLLVASNNGTVYVSDDDGATFNEYTIVAGVSVTGFAAETGSDVYYASVETIDSVDSLYTSTDGGQTWTDMAVTDHGFAEDGRFGGVTVDPLDDNHIVLNTYVPASTSYHTLDGGDTWLALGDTEENRVGSACITFDSSGRLYIGLQYSDDASNEAPTWTTMDNETPQSQLYGDVCAVDPADDDIMYMNTTFGPAVTLDRTATWTDVVNGMSAVKSYAIAQSTDKATVWIGANGGLAKTTNFTDETPTWDYPVSPRPGGSTIKAVWVDPADANHVVAGAGDKFAYTTDGGTTWTDATMASTTGFIVDIEPSRVDDQTLYGVYYYSDLSGDDTGGVLQSTDAGVTWTSLAITDDAPATSLSVASDDTLYVGVGGDFGSPGVYVYNGSAWSALSGGPNGLPISSLLVDASDDQRLFVTNFDSGVGGLYLTEDGGATWTQPNTGLEDINNLNTLTRQTSTSNTYYIAGQDTGTLNGVVYKSTDGGETWNLYYSGLKQESFYALFFDGLLAANDRGVYDLKSLATFTKLRKTRSGPEVTWRFRMNDASTGKRLKHKRVQVLKRSHDKWVVFKRVRTNDRGRLNFTMLRSETRRIKLRWRPGVVAANEYTRSVSRVYRVR